MADREAIVAIDILIKSLTAVGAYLAALSGIALADDAMHGDEERQFLKCFVRWSIPLITALILVVALPKYSAAGVFHIAAAIFFVSFIPPLALTLYDGHRSKQPSGKLTRLVSGLTIILFVLGFELLLAAATLDLCHAMHWL